MEITREILDRFNANSLYRTIGIQISSAAGGQAASTLAPSPDVCWPFTDQPHGGMLFTLMDTTMAWAVLTELDSGLNCTTIDLHIQYLRPATAPPYLCRADVVRMGRRIGFVRADILDSGDNAVATGQGVFRIIRTDIMV